MAQSEGIPAPANLVRVEPLGLEEKMTWEIHEAPQEERANATLHGLGAMLAAVGLIFLVARASLHDTGLHMGSATVYGASMVLLYLASTLYHGVSQPRVKDVLEVLDHSAIYLLIAGTYTPFALITLGGSLGWILLSVVWGVAAVGITLQVVFPGRFRTAMTLLYLAMAWLAVFAAGPLLSRLSPGGLVLLLGGGFFYTSGVYFYHRKRFTYSHAVWHLFVLAGSACHYAAIYGYVLPGGA
jgi:hemolysin III